MLSTRAIITAVARTVVANGTVADRTEAFDRFLADGRPGHVSHYAIEPGRAIDIVRAAGGVPVIAHPWGRSSYTFRRRCS